MPQVALPGPSPGPEHHYYCKPTAPCPEVPTTLTTPASARKRASRACDRETSQAHTLCFYAWAPLPLLSSSSMVLSSSWCHKGWRTVVEGACHATKNRLVVLQVIKKTGRQWKRLWNVKQNGFVLAAMLNKEGLVVARVGVSEHPLATTATDLPLISRLVSLLGVSDE